MHASHVVVVYKEIQCHCTDSVQTNSTHQHLDKMEAHGNNAFQLQRQRMLRSQGPINVTVTTHLNPAGCYICSYDCNEKCNVNASFNTVGLLIREKRKKLVTEIASLLGDYSGDWYAPSLRPRNLPLHPLDWSSTLLQQLCKFVQFLPRDIPTEQRLALAHQAMLGGRHDTGRTEHPAETAKMANPDTMSYTNETSSVDGQNTEVEKLRAEAQRLLDQIQAMEEEVTSFADDLIELRDRNSILEIAIAEVSAVKQGLSEEESPSLEHEEALRKLEKWQAVVAQHKPTFGFFLM